jgi:hypothetical protein
VLFVNEGRQTWYFEESGNGLPEEYPWRAWQRVARRIMKLIFVCSIRQAMVFCIQEGQKFPYKKEESG